jgi:Na+/alanine symporter
MDSMQMAEDLQIAWVWVAAPIALVAALVLAFHLRVPQIVRLADAFRALRGRDPEAGGSMPPAASAALAAVASYGAAGAIGAATAVSLGGAGAIAWVWLFALLLAPLRMGETLLARSAPPGKTGQVPGSLAGRLLADRAGFVQGLGWVLLALVPIAAFAYYGGAHGAAVRDAAERLYAPGGTEIALAVALMGAALALVPLRRAGTLLGWAGAVLMLAIVGTAIAALASEPSRGVGAFGRSIMDALYDAPRMRSFAGATAGEIAFAAMLHLFPPIAAGGGVEGAIHAEAQAPVKKQALAALLGPLAYGVLATVLGFSIVATGAFGSPVEDTRSANELRAYRVGFETVSQRNEESRWFSGLLRIEDGDQGVLRTEMATERGMARTVFVDPSMKEPPSERPGGKPEKRLIYASWFDGERPADILLRFDQGRVVDLQSRTSHGGRANLSSLSRRPLSDLEHVVLRAEMLPRGALLVRSSMQRGAGTIVAKIALIAILMLGALGAAAWGIGVARTLRAKLPEKVARAASVIPAIGLALAAFGVVPSFALLGSFAAALLVVATSVALLLRASEAGKLRD